MQFNINIIVVVVVVVVFVVSTAVFVVVNNNDNKKNNNNNGVDIDLQKGSKWANYGNMAKMNTTIKKKTTATTPVITMVSISICKRAQNG